jgi:hypothetical protein
MSAGIHLDELFLTKGAGAVDDETLRVQLSDESLAALENINVTVSNEVEIKNDANNPIPVAGSVSVSGSVSVAPINVAIKNSAETVTATAAQVLVTPLANRKQVTIQNEGSKDVYIGATGVTSANGIKISRNSSATYAWGPAIAIYMISASGSQDVRFLEEA